MSEDLPQGAREFSPEDLIAAAAASGMPIPVPGPMPGRSSVRTKIFIALLVGGIGVGASAMSCVGQSFSLRQARALEGIEQQLRARCVVPPTGVR